MARRLVHDDTLDLADRVAGALVVLYAQPITRVVGLTTAHLQAADGRVTVALGPDRLELPEPFATLIAKLPHRRRVGTAAHLPNQWLFPSTRAGKHATPGAVANRLRRIGVTGRAMSHAALMQLAAEIPPGMLAGILGIHPTTAVKWTKLAGGDWTRYAGGTSRPNTESSALRPSRQPRAMITPGHSSFALPDCLAPPGRAAWPGRQNGEATMTRTFLQADDLRDFVSDQFGADRRLSALNRLTGGTKKGVYRLVLDDATTAILYVWAAGENYWPPAPAIPGDPFTDASGAELFAANHAALSAAEVRIPRLFTLDRDGRYLNADIALVEDAGTLRLETLMDSDPAAAVEPLAALGDAVRRMHTTSSPHYGKLAFIAHGEAPQMRRAEDVIVDRALGHLDAVAARDVRIADAHHRIAAHVHGLAAAVTPRDEYRLVHGELGPDHVLVTPAGEPVIIDFEGLVYFDVEWDHAWMQMRFADAYPTLRPVPLDTQRLEFYRYAQLLSLIEGPLRIADTDFPDRDWMLDLAERSIGKALAAI